jgi:hypothetical protein
MGIQRIVLKNHGYVTIPRTDLIDAFISDIKIAFIHLLQTGYHVQRGRFAASAGTQQNAKFPIFNIEVKAGHRFYLSKIFTHIFEHDFRQLRPSLIAINPIQQGAERLASGCWSLASGFLLLLACPWVGQQPVARSLK